MVQISTQRLRDSEFFGKHTLRPLCSLRLLPPQNSKLSTPSFLQKYSAMNSQNTETKRKRIKFTIKLQLSYTSARAWPHRFHVRLMADTFVFNHVEQIEHVAMPHYLSLHDLHGLSNLNRTKTTARVSPHRFLTTRLIRNIPHWILIFRFGAGRARSDVFDGPAWRGVSEVKRTFGFCFRCSVVEVNKISPAV